ncbi:HIT family protein [Candidatus Woesearchaeota archaeon]|nr:HIT family protein [Candidatus Woesearchaeota archaeon]
MDGCLFCKIASGQIPCHKAYEDKQFLAFLDIRPRNRGHTLLIPKKHYRWVWDMREEYSVVLNRIANAQKKAFGTEFVVSFVIGEEVPHAHFHLVPRFPNDGHGALIDLSNVKNFTEKELKEQAERIRQFLAKH